MLLMNFAFRVEPNDRLIINVDQLLLFSNMIQAARNCRRIVFIDNFLI